MKWNLERPKGQGGGAIIIFQAKSCPQQATKASKNILLSQQYFTDAGQASFSGR